MCLRLAGLLGGRSSRSSRSSGRSSSASVGRGSGRSSSASVGRSSSRSGGRSSGTSVSGSSRSSGRCSSAVVGRSSSRSRGVRSRSFFLLTASGQGQSHQGSDQQGTGHYGSPVFQIKNNSDNLHTPTNGTSRTNETSIRSWQNYTQKFLFVRECCLFFSRKYRLCLMLE